MRRFWALWLVLSLVVMGLVGCAVETDPADELIAESPFRKGGQRSAADVMVVRCDVSKFRLRQGVDLSRLDFWAEHTVSEATTATVMGLEREMVRYWRKNGLFVAAAKATSWSALREVLVAQGARPAEQTTALIRRAGEGMEVSTYAVDADRSVFVTSAKAALRGTTLPEGECGFRVGLAPEFGEQERRLHLVVTPLVRGEARRDRYVRDEFGQLRRVAEKPEIVFEELRLSGQLENDWFVAILLTGKAHGLGSLGGIFMTPNVYVEDEQLLVILTPRVRSVAELKGEKG